MFPDKRTTIYGRDAIVHDLIDVILDADVSHEVRHLVERLGNARERLEWKQQSLRLITCVKSLM